ncbi:MAG: hypothetical protein COU29_02075 [Candidatus Magasanikbacteria bacterium CG10_big_fil_rev_8_21_14_0_10_36_32]|uniref:Uncharacterized protein n=1 Tax=Candidatus Magasanikbacteria bacterium CG10_big_fil_rev_8_21_14_0_10_36_32 TaxID=1974646 RepID=A0A2M6W737_9BACT|nr:MAG: hypothetical protein COU29_02075 [Candidatus Magasanikbacteria bacterium CG10_big_fil_rev_8_21_14_0_10_36_32]
MRENKRGGLDINLRRAAVSETKGLLGGRGYISDEFRPIEEVEAEESLRGPGRHVNLNEISESPEGESGEYLTVEDRMAVELDKSREQERLVALEEDEDETDEFFNDSTEKLLNESYGDGSEESGGGVVLDSPVKKTREQKDIKVVRTGMLSRKFQRGITSKEYKRKHSEQKPKNKEVKRGTKTLKY